MSDPPSASIVGMAAELVAIPSRADFDAPAHIIQYVSSWLESEGVEFELLQDEKLGAVGVLVTIKGRRPGPALCLNACLDTAPFGNEALWSRAPASGLIEEGRLWGRGAADSKTGVAILMHLARLLQKQPPACGRVDILFDADEHTGRFGGVRAYLASSPPPDVVVLGYPGHERLTTGARGFLRLRIHAHGRSAHSGSVSQRGQNAVLTIVDLVQRLSQAPLPEVIEPDFPFGPAATVTGLEGGQGFSQVPDHAICSLDIRLTKQFDAAAARTWLQDVLAGGDQSISVEEVEHWPAYVTSADHPAVTAFRAVGERVFGNPITTYVCGPSNIGNLLSTRGIATFCGLGVGYDNIHASNEYALLDDIPRVFEVYRAATEMYLAG